MRYTKETIGQAPLDDFVSAIPRIYSGQDKNRSIWDVWLHANHHAAAIGEEVRKGVAGRKLLEEIADFAMWLFTVVHKLHGEIGVAKSGEAPQESLIRIGNTYSDLLWNKYPWMCPVCYWRRSEGNRDREKNSRFSDACDCLQHDVERRNQEKKRLRVKALRAFSHDHRGKMPTSVDDWQSMFARIFRANLRHSSLEDIAFHLLEEMGEVSDAMVRMYTYREEQFVDGEPSWKQIWLEEEFADVSSWLFALVEKLDLMRQTADEYDQWRFGETFVARKPIRLSEILWNRYGSDRLENFFCPHCKSQDVCKCKIIWVHVNRSIEDMTALLRNVLGS